MLEHVMKNVVKDQKKKRTVYFSIKTLKLDHALCADAVMGNTPTQTESLNLAKNKCKGPMMS